MKRALLIAALLLTGCETGERVEGSDVIRRWHDDERGVTCWIVGTYRGGIDCIPDRELGL